MSVAAPVFISGLHLVNRTATFRVLTINLYSGTANPEISCVAFQEDSAVDLMNEKGSSQVLSFLGLLNVGKQYC